MVSLPNKSTTKHQSKKEEDQEEYNEGIYENTPNLPNSKKTWRKSRSTMSILVKLLLSLFSI